MKPNGNDFEERGELRAELVLQKDLCLEGDVRVSMGGAERIFRARLDMNPGCLVLSEGGREIVMVKICERPADELAKWAHETMVEIGGGVAPYYQSHAKVGETLGYAGTIKGSPFLRQLCAGKIAGGRSL